MPPNQRRKKIQSKIDHLNNQITQANGVKDGLLAIRQAYEENKQFGDPKTIECQLRENDAELERLTKELSKHLVLLDEVNDTNKLNNNKIGTLAESDSNKSPSITNSLNHRASLGQDSELSRTNSENSIRPDNSMTARDGTKSSATNRTSNSFADSLSDNASNNAISIAT